MRQRVRVVILPLVVASVLGAGVGVGAALLSVSEASSERPSSRGGRTPDHVTLDDPERSADDDDDRVTDDNDSPGSSLGWGNGEAASSYPSDKATYGSKYPKADSEPGDPFKSRRYKRVYETERKQLDAVREPAAILTLGLSEIWYQASIAALKANIKAYPTGVLAHRDWPPARLEGLMDKFYSVARMRKLYGKAGEKADIWGNTKSVAAAAAKRTYYADKDGEPVVATGWGG